MVIWAGCANKLPTQNFDGPGGQRPPLGSPYGRAGERSEPERAQAVTNFGKMRRLQLVTLSVMTLFPYLLLRTPSQSRLTPCQLSQRESQGAAAPPNLVHHPPSNRVTPSGVGLLPGWQSRHCQRVHTRPAAFSNSRAKAMGTARPPVPVPRRMWGLLLP